MGLLIFCPLDDERPKVTSESHSEELHNSHSQNSESDVLGVGVHERANGGVASLLVGSIVSTGGVVLAARSWGSNVSSVSPIVGTLHATTFQDGLKSVDGVFADRFGLVVVFIHTIPKLFLDGIGDGVLVCVDCDSKGDLPDEDEGNQREVEQEHTSVLGQGTAAAEQTDYEDDAAKRNEEES